MIKGPGISGFPQSQYCNMHYPCISVLAVFFMAGEKKNSVNLLKNLSINCFYFTTEQKASVFPSPHSCKIIKTHLRRTKQAR